MTPLEYYETFVRPEFGERITLGMTLVLLAQYTGGSIYDSSFAITILPLHDDENNYEDFSNAFFPWVRERI